MPLDEKRNPTIVWDTTHDTLTTLVSVADIGFLPVATRQASSSGKSKSPRIQVVLPEGLWESLAAAAEADSRTVSNMAKVLIQQGLERRQPRQSKSELLRSQLERQQQAPAPRLRGRPRRIRLRGAQLPPMAPGG
jgi:hypothetical protein